MGGSTKLMSSGAGGVILTTPGSIASDVTVNLPTQNSTLAINGPAFSAYTTSGSPQSISNATFTKVQFQSEEFDTNSNYDQTLYRFLPTVAGYYQITAAVWLATAAEGITSIYKNGSEFKRGTDTLSNAQVRQATALVYFNGSTDYVEIYTYQASGGSISTGTGAPNTYFQGVLVRAA